MKKLNSRSARRWVLFVVTVRTLVLAIIGTLCTSKIGAREYSAVDLLIEACQKSGNNSKLIQSGFVEFRRSVIESHSAELLDSLTANLDRQFDEQIKNATSPIAAEHMRLTQKAILEGVRSRDGQAVTSRGTILFDGNSMQGYRRLEFVSYDIESKTWSKPQVFLRRDVARTGGESVRWITNRNEAIMDRRIFGLIEFQEFGRIQGATAGKLISQILDRTLNDRVVVAPERIAEVRAKMIESSRVGEAETYLVIGEKEYDRTAKAIVIEVRRPEMSKGHAILERYWIDPTRDYIVPRIEFFAANDKLLEQYVSSDYFLEKTSGLWFPAKYRHQKIGDDEEQCDEYEFEPSTQWFNRSIGPDQFAIAVPEMAKIIDSRGEVTRTYLATNPLVLSFAPGGLDLIENPAVRLNGAAVHKPLVRRWPWIAINVVAMAALVIYVWNRHRRSKNLVGVMLFWLCMLNGCMCSSKASTVDRNIQIEPPVIDLARVQESRGHADSGFQIINNSESELRVKSISGNCTCAKPQISEARIQSHQAVFVPVKILLSNRESSEIQATISVDVIGMRSPIEIPVKGNVEREIWLTGQAVHCTAFGDDPIAKGVLEIGTTKWPTIKFQPLPKDSIFSIAEIGRRDILGETVIRFELSCDIEPFACGITNTLTLTPCDVDVLPLTIPVICHGAP